LSYHQYYNIYYLRVCVCVCVCVCVFILTLTLILVLILIFNLISILYNDRFFYKKIWCKCSFRKS